MCQSDLHDFLHGLPKCEHHVHLEGCLTPELIFQLAAKNGVQLPQEAAYESVETLIQRRKVAVALREGLHGLVGWFLREGHAVLLSQLEDQFGRETSFQVDVVLAFGEAVEEVVQVGLTHFERVWGISNFLEGQCLSFLRFGHNQP